MRANFEKVSLFALLTLLPTLVFAQWLETTIYVPDSLSGITAPRAFTYNPTNNKVYVGGSGNCVIVIDGETNEKIAKIPAGSGILSLCYNSTNNKVYCANAYSGNVTVIDGATNTVITTIGVGVGPWAFTWNSAQNRTYVANYYSSSISVIRDATGIEEDDTAVAKSDLGATIFSGPLLLPEGRKCRIFDITGRVVTFDKMRPGIYFIEVEGKITQKVVKIK